MSEEILGMVFFLSFFGMIAYITRVLSDNRVRREVMNIDANSEHLSAEFITALLQEARSNDPKSDLKWGMVAIAIGGALAFIHLLGLDGEDALTWGLVFICGGGALFTFHLINQDPPPGS